MGSARDAPGVIVCVVGARPNYMKMAPLLQAFRAQPGLPRAVLVHTGQHYDPMMNDRLFADLQLPRPDINLEVGSATHAVQTAEIMRRFEPVLDELLPACVIVVGDINSTLACSLVAAKKGVPVAHVEAGLRSFDRSMPEEINRVVTDQLSSLLYTTEKSAHANLAREGVPSERIEFVGNVMIDSLLSHRTRAVPAETTFARAQWRGARGLFGVVTLHRPSNVDQPQTLAECLEIVCEVAQRIPLVCALHPRTMANIASFGLAGKLASDRVLVLPPQGYLEMLGLMSAAAVVLTDSGGMQEETTALGVPCLTMRENTERPITVEQGTNTVVGRDRNRILRLVDEILEHGGKRGCTPELWDGHAAGRIAAHLATWLACRPQPVPV
ncbi:MAG: non-hydrolyzing UDP-N-acetylglucosamine 2-epimerase [Bacteroidota bacterium]